MQKFVPVCHYAWCTVTPLCESQKPSMASWVLVASVRYLDTDESRVSELCDLRLTHSGVTSGTVV